MTQPVPYALSGLGFGEAGPGDGATPGILVLGIGNVLMGDEGVGVRVAEYVHAAGLPPGVAAVDGGTGGLHLLSLLTGHEAVVLVDATLDGRPPGTVDTRQPRFAADYPPTLVAHDIGLKDLVDAAAVLDAQPRLVLVTVSIGGLNGMSLELSPAVEAAVPRAAEAVREALASLEAGRPGGKHA